MTRTLITRPDGQTVDLDKADANNQDLVALAKRVILVDNSGDLITSLNPLPTTATINTGDIEIGSVEIKNATDDTRAVVKSDGTNNALVVVQNTVPTTTVTATNLDIRDLTSVSDSVEVKQATASNLNANVSGTVTSNSPGDIYIQRIEYDSNGFVIYVGLAVPGSAESSLVWQIKKFTNNSMGQSTAINFADGNLNFDNRWDQRDTYSYS
jgi:hypothetical protein